jgi:hypothetical protein
LRTRERRFESTESDALSTQSAFFEARRRSS